MPMVTVTTDADQAGFELEVEPLDGGGWVSAQPGFHGFGPGQVTKIYVDGEPCFAQRRWQYLALLPE
jgi:hypothetical protein